MAKDDFVNGYLEKLVNKDNEIKTHFENAKSEKEKDLLYKALKGSLENSYDTYAKNYFDSKGLGSYVSTFLRSTGAAADVAGTYMFWALGGAGFGLKGVGMAEKSLADLVDSYHYAKHAKTDSISEKIKDEALENVEGLAERAAAYLPLGVGEIADFLRGRSKYDSKVTARALYHAKENFKDYIRPLGNRPKITSLDNFKNPVYDLEGSTQTAA